MFVLIIPKELSRSLIFEHLVYVETTSVAIRGDPPPTPRYLQMLPFASLIASVTIDGGRRRYCTATGTGNGTCTGTSTGTGSGTSTATGSSTGTGTGTGTHTGTVTGIGTGTSTGTGTGTDTDTITITITAWLVASGFV